MERRTQPRNRRHLEAMVFIAGIPAYGGRLRDISEQGAYVHMQSCDLDIGQRVAVDLRQAGRALQDGPMNGVMNGVVIRVEPSGFALHFDRPVREVMRAPSISAPEQGWATVA